jgi:hypothetical protein
VTEATKTAAQSMTSNNTKMAVRRARVEARAVAKQKHEASELNTD